MRPGQAHDRVRRSQPALWARIASTGWSRPAPQESNSGDASGPTYAWIHNVMDRHASGQGVRLGKSHWIRTPHRDHNFSVSALLRRKSRGAGMTCTGRRCCSGGRIHRKFASVGSGGDASTKATVLIEADLMVNENPESNGVGPWVAKGGLGVMAGSGVWCSLVGRQPMMTKLPDASHRDRSRLPCRCGSA